MADDREEPAQAEGGEPFAHQPYGGLTADQFRVLASHLRESVILLDENWELVANLSAPDGLLGWGDPVGNHALAHIHPDDVLNFVDVGQGLSGTDLGWKGAAHLRLQRVDGNYLRYETTMENRVADPEVQGWIACTREAPVAMETSPEMEGAEIASSLLEALPQGVLVFGHDKILFSNQAASEILGAEPHWLAVNGLAGVVEADARAELRAAVLRLGRVEGQQVVLLPEVDGGRRRFEVALSSRREPGAEGRLFLVIGVVEDVTHEVARQEELEHRASRDDLTGLHNRAWLLDRLHGLLLAGHEVTIGFVDLCGFKLVNDKLGHRAGDRVLAAISGGLSAEFGDECVARVGGDEFLVLSTDSPPAAALVDRVRRAVAAVPEARRHEVNGNVGVAVSNPSDGPWSLIERADAAMYEDKRSDPRHQRHRA